MEYIDDNVSKDGLSFSPQLKIDLDNLAYWARFLGIVGLVFSVIFLLFIIVGGSMFLSIMGGGALGAESGMPAAFGTAYLVIMGAFFAFYAYLAYLLFDSGRKLKTGLRMSDQGSIEAGITKLKTLFKIVGILTMVLVVIYGIIFLFALIGGGMAALGS